MRRRRAMGMGVTMGMAVAVMVVVGMVVRHGKMLHYNITEVHAVTLAVGSVFSNAPTPSCPAKAGASSTPRPVGSIIDVSGVLDRPPSRTMTTAYDLAISRRLMRPRSASISPLEKQRAQGRPGACCTRGLVCCLRIARAAHEHTGQREHSGLPCAMALRLTSCSSRRTALLPPLSQRSFASPERNASTATSEPHDFAVRFRRVRLSRHPRPSHLTTRS